ncbi:MAG: hypothetical protein JW920_06365 [Deltaproteobacteria bacterium]|nr:hypothetical protein [Deltaproteobacteria bacterium]
MIICSRCVLPQTFPGISFDQNGVCNYCSHTQMPGEDEKQDYLKRFESLLAEKKSNRDFDVILAYSGGKDSTYTLYLLRKHYDLKVLSLVFDNGFISDQAKYNINQMTDTLGATNIIVKPPFDLMQKAFHIAAQKEFYSPKTLDRASSICTTCIGMVKGIILKTALALEIPLVAFGWSPGQAPLSSAIMQTNPRLQRITHRTIRDPLLSLVGKELQPYFLHDVDLSIEKSRWPINIHPLAFFEYDEGLILDTIKKLGWVKPDDTDPNSTNCLLNALANYLHRKRFDFHPYAWEIAGIVRSGCMHREEGIEKVSQDEDMQMVGYAAKLLNIAID